MSKNRDIYQEWKDTGKLKEVIEFIVDCSTKRYLNKKWRNI